MDDILKFYKVNAIKLTRYKENYLGKVYIYDACGGGGGGENNLAVPKKYLPLVKLMLEFSRLELCVEKCER